MNFYDTFSKLCNQKQITPSAAAIKIGLTKTAVSNWKTRNTKPTRANLVRIAEFFDVSVDSLLGKEDIKKEPIKMIGSLTIIICLTKKIKKQLICLFLHFSQNKNTKKKAM